MLDSHCVIGRKSESYLKAQGVNQLSGSEGLLLTTSTLGHPEDSPMSGLILSSPAQLAASEEGQRMSMSWQRAWQRTGLASNGEQNSEPHLLTMVQVSPPGTSPHRWYELQKLLDVIVV